MKHVNYGTKALQDDRRESKKKPEEGMTRLEKQLQDAIHPGSDDQDPRKRSSTVCDVHGIRCQSKIGCTSLTHLGSWGRAVDRPLYDAHHR